VNTFRKWRNLLVILSIIGILLSIWFAAISVPPAAAVFGISSAALFALLIWQMRKLHDAKLIWSNRILAVPSAVILTAGRDAQIETDETIVSTFGILIGGRIYKWGCGGVQGTRLNRIEISRERIVLHFGNGIRAVRAELLHGMADRQKVTDVAEKLLYETGVTATIIDW